MNNPEKIEIEGLKTIHKLCKFGADHNMEGCSFAEIVERMFDELAKSQAVPKWISVDEQEPECGETVLICWSDALDVDPEMDFMDIDVETGAYYWSNCEADKPTHWMHLPKMIEAQEQSHECQNP